MNDSREAVEKEAQGFEALKIVYIESGRRAAALADRQYSVTLQLLGLHAGIITVAILHRETLTACIQALGTTAILILDTLAIAYIVQKARSYWRSQDLNQEAEERLRAVAGLADKTSPRKKSRIAILRGFDGSAYFVVAALIACAITIATLYMPKSLSQP